MLIDQDRVPIGVHQHHARRAAARLVRGGIDLELRALQWLFGVYLPRSIYVPDDHPCFEAFIGRPPAPDAERFELFAQVPVRRA